MILWVAVSGRLDIQWFSYKLPLLLLLLPGLTGELNKTVGEGRQGNCPQKHKFPRQWNWLPMGDKNCMQEKKMGFKKKKGTPVLALHQISVKHWTYSYVAVPDVVALIVNTAAGCYSHRHASLSFSALLSTHAAHSVLIPCVCLKILCRLIHICHIGTVSSVTVV